MTTLGYTTTPSFGTWGEGWNVGDQVALQATMPSPGGLISAIHCYAATFAGTATMDLVIWDAGGNALASVAAGASVGTSPAWVSATLSTPLFVASGAVIFIGWANPNNTSSNNGFTAHYDQAGGTCKWNLQSSVPNNLLSGTNPTQYANRNIGAYVDYTVAGAWINTGTAGAPVWTAASGVLVNTGTPGAPTWTQASEVAVNTGTPGAPTWTPGS